VTERADRVAKRVRWNGSKKKKQAQCDGDNRNNAGGRGEREEKSNGKQQLYGRIPNENNRYI
jgi:hypothetical protein